MASAGVSVDRHAGRRGRSLTSLRALAALAFVNPLIRLPEFMLGMGAGLAFAEGWRPNLKVRLPVALLVLLCLVAGLLHLPKPLMDPVLAPIFVAIVVAFAGSDVAGERGRLTRRGLVYAGEVSFCFYLVHELVIVNVAPLHLRPGCGGR